MDIDKNTKATLCVANSSLPLTEFNLAIYQANMPQKTPNSVVKVQEWINSLPTPNRTGEKVIHSS